MTKWHAAFALLSVITSRVMWGCALVALFGIAHDLQFGIDPTARLFWFGGFLVVALLSQREFKRIARDLPPAPGETILGTDRPPAQGTKVVAEQPTQSRSDDVV